jgi:hypothetical protein
MRFGTVPSIVELRHRRFRGGAFDREKRTVETLETDQILEMPPQFVIPVCDVPGRSSCRWAAKALVSTKVKRNFNPLAPERRSIVDAGFPTDADRQEFPRDAFAR